MLKMEKQYILSDSSHEVGLTCLQNLIEIKQLWKLNRDEYYYYTQMVGKPHTSAADRMEATVKEYKLEYERCKDIITPKYG